MDFRGTDPGAVQFGNFINYYKFHSASDRIALLPDNVWLPLNDDTQNETTPYLVLDVGCNAGDLTRLLHDYLSERIKRDVYILGVDLDPVLIERAKETNQTNKNIDFRCVDVMKKDDFSTEIEGYLKSWNVSKFDAVCCFSITMWIHLNHQESGLQDFLTKLSKVAKLFIVEPQPWKCYRTAVRRMSRSAKESFPHFSQLKWTTNIENEIQSYLENNLQLKIVHETLPTKWMRRIWFYR